MTLANPFGLIGLLSLPVILILHLLRERQRRYVVSSLTLWAFLEDRLRGPRLRRIPRSWLLVLDLLIGALLSLAWAQPRLTLPLDLFDSRHVVILIDVSASMRASYGLNSRLSLAKAEALSLLNDLGRRDAATVVAFGSQPHPVGDSRQEDYQELARRIEGLEAGETGGSALRAALALGQAALDGSLPAEFYILTDGALPAGSLAPEGTFDYPLHWRLFSQEVDNQAVLEVNATPLEDNQVQVFARIANFGAQAASRPIYLEVDGQVLDNSSVQIPPDSTVPKIWELPVGDAAALRVSLAGRDSLEEDDSGNLGLRQSGIVQVALVAADPAPLQQALLSIPGVELEVFTPQDYPSLAERFAGGSPFDLVIFRDFIPAAWPSGQVLVVEPPEAAENAQDTSSAPGSVSLLSQARQDIPAAAPTRILAADPVVTGIDFGGVRWTRAWVLDSIPPGFTPLLQAGGAPLLLRGKVERQGANPADVLVLLADLARGNFSRHPAFPILMANVVQNIYSSPLDDQVKTGESIRLPAAGGYERLRILPPGKPAVDFDGRWPAVWEGTLDPGLYRFQLADSTGGQVEFTAGINAGDETESDLRPRSWVQAAIQASGSTGLPESGSAGAAGEEELQDLQLFDLAPWLLGAAILILLAEAHLAWRR